eukprot:COSAG02_NODE_9931_length_2071_cov_1.788540_2_plen_117_part_00
MDEVVKEHEAMIQEHERYEYIDRGYINLGFRCECAFWFKGAPDLWDDSNGECAEGDFKLECAGFIRRCWLARLGCAEDRRNLSESLDSDSRVSDSARGCTYTREALSNFDGFEQQL